MYGVLQASKSTRQLWRYSSTRTTAYGRGPASLVLGSDAVDHVVTVQAGERLAVSTTGEVNSSLVLGVRGAVRLNAPPPTGYAWQLEVSIGTYTRVLLFSATNYGDSHTPLTLDLDDQNINLSLVVGPGVVTLAVALELVQDPDDPGPAGVDLVVTLPSVYFDQFVVPETAPTIYLENRIPAPAQAGVPDTWPTIQFTICDTDGSGVDLSATTVTVDGVVAYTAGAFQAPWSGSVTPDGPGTPDVTFLLTVPAANLPYASEQLIEVEVTTDLAVPVGPLVENWAFSVADTVPPAVRTATMLDKYTLRVQFTDDMRLDATSIGALNPGNYTVVRVSAPAVELGVAGILPITGVTDAVDVVFDRSASFGANYTLFVKDVVDTSGNTLSPSGMHVPFLGFVPPRPVGRRFELLDFVADENLRADATAAEGGDPQNPGTGDLRRFLACLQDVVDLLLCMIDEWPKIIDIDLAPEPFLDAILQDLGNPFAECIGDLSISDKRRLARVLISIYKQKGTRPGVINAIRFFVGIEVTLDVINYRQYWQLGISLLEDTSILAPPVGSPLWYSFYVVSPVVLTDEQRARILCIAQYMKGAHEHVLGVLEPGDVVTPSPYWILSTSLLGGDPNTGPSSILA